MEDLSLDMKPVEFKVLFSTEMNFSSSIDMDNAWSA
jgi:hypothetical protein